MTNKLTVAAVAALGASLLPMTASAGLYTTPLVNANFADPDIVPASEGGTGGPGSNFNAAVPDWADAVGGSGFIQAQNTPTAPDGDGQWGGMNATEDLYQEIGTYTPGAIYTVTVDLGERIDAQSWAGLTVQLLSGGTIDSADDASEAKTGADAFDGVALDATVLDEFVFDNTALLAGQGVVVADAIATLNAGTAGTTGDELWLRFVAGGVEGATTSNQSLIDNVRIGEAIPEPTSLALLGLGGLGMLRRRHV